VGLIRFSREDCSPDRNQDMENDDRALVLERLHELEGWADYITGALHLNQQGEAVRRDMLERVVEGQALKELRELSWSLRDKLHVIATKLEHSHGEVPGGGIRG
jgi:hypothetical protein